MKATDTNDNIRSRRSSATSRLDSAERRPRYIPIATTHGNIRATGGNITTNTNRNLEQPTTISPNVPKRKRCFGDDCLLAGTPQPSLQSTCAEESFQECSRRTLLQTNVVKVCTTALTIKSQHNVVRSVGQMRKKLIRGLSYSGRLPKHDEEKKENIVERSDAICPTATSSL